MPSRRDVEKVVDLLTRNRKVHSEDLIDALEIAPYLTKLGRNELNKLGSWLFFQGVFPEKAFIHAVKRLEVEDSS